MHHEIKERSFKTDDFILGLQQLRRKWPTEKLCCLLDNCSIHRAHNTKYAAEKLRIKLVFNEPFRPDLMGIERWWAYCKRIYWNHVDHMKTSSYDWRNQLIVEDIIENLSDNEVAKRCAMHGFKKLELAQPIERLPYEGVEPPQQHYLVPPLEFSESQESSEEAEME